MEKIHKVNYKPQLFQLQRFYNSRRLFYDVFPGFKVHAEKVKDKLKNLNNAPFTITGKLRVDLMNWFLNQLKYQKNILEILDVIPELELIPDSGLLLSKEEYINKYAIKETLSPSLNKINVVANMHGEGGGEFSIINIMNMFIKDGYHVNFYPTKYINPSLKELFHQNIVIKDKLSECVIESSKIFLLYSNDFVYYLKQNKDKIEQFFNKSERSVCCVNFTIGECWQTWFSSRIDKFIFLNKTKEKDFRKKVKVSIVTRTLPPPIDLLPFLNVKQNYDKIDFIRTGRTMGKYDQEKMVFLTRQFLNISPQSNFYFMPYPDYLKDEFKDNSLFHFYRWNTMPMDQFLSKGNLFHYHLPKDMKDQGPRSIMEAQSSAIPVICPPRDGCLDRNNLDIGWFAETPQDFINIVKDIKRNPKILQIKGEKAREWAINKYDKQQWLKEIIGEKENG